MLEDGDFEAKVVAIGEAAVVHHDDVADAIDEAVDDDALEVRVAAVEALGTMPVEGALAGMRTLRVSSDAARLVERLDGARSLAAWNTEHPGAARAIRSLAAAGLVRFQAPAALPAETTAP